MLLPRVFQRENEKLGVLKNVRLQKVPTAVPNMHLISNKRRKTVILYGKCAQVKKLEIGK
jgi:hypothetical protein